MIQVADPTYKHYVYCMIHPTAHAIRQVGRAIKARHIYVHRHRRRNGVERTPSTFYVSSFGMTKWFKVKKLSLALTTIWFIEYPGEHRLLSER